MKLTKINIHDTVISFDNGLQLCFHDDKLTAVFSPGRGCLIPDIITSKGRMRCIIRAMDEWYCDTAILYPQQILDGLNWSRDPASVPEELIIFEKKED